MKIKSCDTCPLAKEHKEYSPFTEECVDQYWYCGHPVWKTGKREDYKIDDWEEVPIEEYDPESPDFLPLEEDNRKTVIRKLHKPLPKRWINCPLDISPLLLEV